MIHYPLILSLFLVLGSVEAKTGKTLFKDATSEDERISILSKYFSPDPRDIITIAFNSSENKGKKRLEKAGRITVNPPKGYCFNITISKAQPDIYVCKRTLIKFKLKHVRGDGTFSWMVSSGELDFGTDISWQTPYRYGEVKEEFDDDKSKPVPVLVTSCERKAHEENTEITLKTIDDLFFKIDIPSKRIPAKLRCGDVNTYLKRGRFNQVIIKDPSKIRIGKGAKMEEIRRCAAKWRTDYKNSFSLPASRFVQKFGFRTNKGICRYSFQGFAPDPKSAVIECHDVENYKFVYLPMTCLDDN